MNEILDNQFCLFEPEYNELSEWAKSRVNQKTVELTLASADPVKCIVDANKMIEPCEFCGRGKPIKAFTVLPDSNLQYGLSVKAKFCPMCGRPLNTEVRE